jgi:steroid 5-alpha reductase family enzyme
LISYLQTFVLQGVIGWIVALPVLSAKYFSHSHDALTTLDYIGAAIFAVGFFFETVGDFQLRMFQGRKDRQPGEILNTGLWRYTRHPNYFGDATLWWGIWIVSLSSDLIMGLVSAISPVIMTFLLIKVSGVAMLDKVMTRKTGAYALYKETTSGFIPWFPKTLPKRAD